MTAPSDSSFSVPCGLAIVSNHPFYFDGEVTPALELGLPVVWVNRQGERLGANKPRLTHEVRTLAEAADLILGTR